MVAGKGSGSSQTPGGQRGAPRRPLGEPLEETLAQPSLAAGGGAQVSPVLLRSFTCSGSGSPGVRAEGLRAWDQPAGPKGLGRLLSEAAAPSTAAWALPRFLGRLRTCGKRLGRRAGVASVGSRRAASPPTGGRSGRDPRAAPPAEVAPRGGCARPADAGGPGGGRRPPLGDAAPTGVGARGGAAGRREAGRGRGWSRGLRRFRRWHRGRGRREAEAGRRGGPGLSCPNTVEARDGPGPPRALGAQLPAPPQAALI